MTLCTCSFVGSAATEGDKDSESQEQELQEESENQQETEQEFQMGGEACQDDKLETQKEASDDEGEAEMDTDGPEMGVVPFLIQ